MNKVWIEPEKPTTAEEGHERAKLMSNMLERLGYQYPNAVEFNERHFDYQFNQNCGTYEIGHGRFYNLDYLGRGEKPNPLETDENITSCQPS